MSFINFLEIFNNNYLLSSDLEASTKEIKMLHLNEENMATHGFARFHYKGEEQVVTNVWLRDIEIANYGPGKVEHLQIVLPAKQLIPLSNDKKNRITSWKDFSINPGAESTAPINILSQRAGWNQTLEGIEKIVNVNPDAIFIASLKAGDSNIALGSGTVWQVGEKLNWIGMILVHPELRRQGIANEIMKRCIEFARTNRNIPVLGLDATSMGMPLYTAMGFKESFRIWRSTLSTNESFDNIENVLIEPMKSIDMIEEYLLAKSLSGKLQLFKHLFDLQEEGCFVAKSAGKICGVLMSRPGRLKPYIGHLLADSVQFSKSLLCSALQYWKKKEYETVFLDIPEYHFQQKFLWDETSNSYLPPNNCSLHSSIKPVRELVRMYQLIDDNEMENLLNIKSANRSKITIMNNYEEALRLAAENTIETLRYMEIEKTKVLPYLYSTGGPEFS